MFQFWAQVWALAPGLPGMYLRRAFYQWTLAQCDSNWHIGFGSLFTHPTAVVEPEVYVGCYALIGTARLGRRALIGSRVSILSGGRQHEWNAAGHWSATVDSRLDMVEIGADCWLGEGAIVMATIGEGAMVAAGAVVGSPVPPRVLVAGNPARFTRRLDVAHVTPPALNASHAEASAVCASDRPATDAAS